MKNIEKVMENVGGKFWTRQNEMVKELESLDYEVVEMGWDRLVVVDLQDEDETEYTLHIGHANSTMWVEDAEAEAEIDGEADGDEDLEAANRFWDEARSRVLAIAEAHGFQLALANHDDSFLFELYDNGENVPSEAEVVEAIREFLDVVPGEGACSGNCQSCPYLDFDSGFPGETLTCCKLPGHERILDVDFDVSAVI